MAIAGGPANNAALAAAHYYKQRPAGRKLALLQRTMACLALLRLPAPKQELGSAASPPIVEGCGIISQSLSLPRVHCLRCFHWDPPLCGDPLGTDLCSLCSCVVVVVVGAGVLCRGRCENSVGGDESPATLLGLGGGGAGLFITRFCKDLPGFGSWVGASSYCVGGGFRWTRHVVDIALIDDLSTLCEFN